MDNSKNNIIFYKDELGNIKFEVFISDDDIWLTENQLAEIYQTTRQNINLHIKNIYNDKELDKSRTCKDFLQVRKEGSREVKRVCLSDENKRWKRLKKNMKYIEKEK